LAVPEFHPVNPAGQADAAELDRLARTAETNGRVSGSRTVTVRRSSAGLALDAPLPPAFWALITGSTSGVYSWGRAQDQIISGAVAWTLHPDGPSGGTGDFPAYEINGLDAILNDKVVWLEYSKFGDYCLFDYCCGATTAVVPAAQRTVARVKHTTRLRTVFIP
jgi:hypothetical protein